jgi:hypothetical protein
VDEWVVDPAGSAAWVSLVLVPPQVAPLFDDPAVSQAMRRVLAARRSRQCQPLYATPCTLPAR